MKFITNIHLLHLCVKYKLEERKREKERERERERERGEISPI